MFINPKHAIEQGWVTGIRNEKQIQPNAIDFTLDRVFEFEPFEMFEIYEVENELNSLTETKVMRRQTELLPSIDPDNEQLRWVLSPKSSYDAMSNLHVTLPEDIAAILVIRSTFNRNGIFISTGLYDSGFSGSVGFHIHNSAPNEAKIGHGVRIGQIIFVQASSAHKYAGGYNTEAGQHWVEAILKKIHSGYVE